MIHDAPGPRRRPTAIAAAALIALAALATGPFAPSAGAHAPRPAPGPEHAPRFELAPVTELAPMAAAPAGALPALPSVAAGPARLPAGPAQVRDGRAARLAPAGAHQGVVDTSIDGFEAVPWPDPALWPLVADLEAIARGDAGGGAPWAPASCGSTEGSRALRAASDGRACDAPYPAGAASSALLALDLSHTAADRALSLAFDVWMDADPDEGLLLHYVRIGADGRAVERRQVWSGTGRLGDWVHGVSIDLTDLRDRFDSTWRYDLRGRRVHLELLFRSGDGSDARGALLDRLRLVREPAPPTPVPSATTAPTAVPTPVPPTPTTPPDLVRTNACTPSGACVQLAVRAYVDFRCDGRLQPGVDSPLRAEPAPRVDVEAGAERLGGPLSASGTAIFLFPPVPETRVALAVPEGFEACPGVDNPATVASDAFRRGLARLELRVRRR